MIYEWFQNIQFAHPFYFFLFILVPILIVYYVFFDSKKQASFMFSSIKQIPSRKGWKITFRHTPFVFRLLALSCIIMGLARPQTRNDQELVSGEGIDIILCLDVSGSMLAQDFKPNRMEAAKEVAANFVDSRETDRIGLVIFSGESFTLSPITTDHNILKTQIYNIQSGLLEDGTAIGMGLATSVERLKTSKSKSRVIVLLTDGENNGGLIDPGTAKEIAKSVGVKVYTIGVGTEGLAEVPVQTPGGVIMQKELVNIDEKLLTQIAMETGGKYFRAKDNETLISIYSEIDKLEKTRVEVTALRRFTEKFLPFAIAAAAFVFIEYLLKLVVFRKFP
ncbi:MAG: VWA domain-containing protein [Chitinophagaceae bacterium]